MLPIARLLTSIGTPLIVFWALTYRPNVSTWDTAPLAVLAACLLWAHLPGAKPPEQHKPRGITLTPQMQYNRMRSRGTARDLQRRRRLDNLKDTRANFDRLFTIIPLLCVLASPFIVLSIIYLTVTPATRHVTPITPDQLRAYEHWLIDEGCEPDDNWREPEEQTYR